MAAWPWWEDGGGGRGVAVWMSVVTASRTTRRTFTNALSADSHSCRFTTNLFSLKVEVKEQDEQLGDNKYKTAGERKGKREKKTTKQVNGENDARNDSQVTEAKIEGDM